MVNVAVLGYGVVGSGVVEVLDKNSSTIKIKLQEEISVKKVLDVRAFPDDPYRDLITKNADEIFNDKSIKIVIETIGGTSIAYEFTKKALSLGKHVVTSNKELVATCGPELLKLAKENNVNYLFEASVGGGVPIIRPLNQCLAGNDIIEIIGILNGTTNYILTCMKKAGMDFSDALKQAQANGYAEADPTADIEGHDACRKIAILSSIAFNQFVDSKKVWVQGITKISLKDLKYAQEMDSVIKLIAVSKKENGKVFVRVSPAIVGKNHPLANVEDVFNAIVVKGDAVGEVMFYGRGAGKLPTASAVVADVIDIVRHIDSNNKVEWNIQNEDNIIDIKSSSDKHFVRLKTDGGNKTGDAVNRIFGEVNWVKTGDVNDEIAFVTSEIEEKKFDLLLDSVKDIGFTVLNTIRML